MVQYRRNRVDGGTYFLTLTLRDRASEILTRHAEVLRESFRYVQMRRAFVFDAVVVMPDHLHLLCTLPEGDADYSERMRLLKRHFTEAVGRRNIWQPRFWEHTIRDEEDFASHFDYIHFNPVKHGYVNRVVDWPHSSFHRYLRKGVLPEDWGGDMQEAGDGQFGE